MTTITLNKGGTAETTIEASEIPNVPDLFNMALDLEELGHINAAQSKMILDCWHLAHNLKRHIQEHTA